MSCLRAPLISNEEAVNAQINNMTRHELSLFLSLLVLQGFGMLLMEEAERIAREEHGSHKISVISGKT